MRRIRKKEEVRGSRNRRRSHGRRRGRKKGKGKSRSALCCQCEKSVGIGFGFELGYGLWERHPSPVTRPCPPPPLHLHLHLLHRRLSHHIQKFSCQKHTISACRGRRSGELRYLRQQSHRFCSQWVQARRNEGREEMQGVAGTLRLTLMRSPSESCPPPTPLPPAPDRPSGKSR